MFGHAAEGLATWREVLARVKRSGPGGIGVHQGFRCCTDANQAELWITNENLSERCGTIVKNAKPRESTGNGAAARLKQRDARKSSGTQDHGRQRKRATGKNREGAGLGGLAWADVRPRIWQALSALPDVEVILFEPI